MVDYAAKNAANPPYISIISALPVPPAELLQSIQYNWAYQFAYSTEMRLAFEGLVNLIPMCHTEILAQEGIFKESPIYLSQQFKPFEHKTEIIFMQRFLQNIHHNLH